MQTTKKSYQQVLTFVQNAQQWLETQRDETTKQIKETKFTYAIHRVMKKCQEICIEYQELVEDLDNKHCVVDKDDQSILKDQRGKHKFTKEGLKARDRERKELFKSEVDAPQYIATTLPKYLPFELKEIFDGFVLNFDPEKEEPKDEEDVKDEPKLEVVN